ARSQARAAVRRRRPAGGLPPWGTTYFLGGDIADATTETPRPRTNVTDGTRYTERRGPLATVLNAGLPLRWSVLEPRNLTPGRAVRAIASLTILLTCISGVAMHLVDRHEFPTIGLGLWWAVQTVTTVGYGDIVPA